MNTFKASLLIALSALFTWGAENVCATERDMLFNKEWKFYLGPLANAEQPDYDDSRWRTLDLPHDWSVEPVAYQCEGITIGPFTRLSEKRYPADQQMGGGAWDVGQTIGGEGWYRKTFVVPHEDAGKCITLYIEAASSQSEVWVNGTKAYFNAYSYTPYKLDITRYLNAPGTPNLIAVKAVNNGNNSRWYIGSGLFRNVWLITTDKLHLDRWDTYIDASRIEKKKAVVNFSTMIHNKSLPTEQGEIRLRILDPAGKEVYSTRINTATTDSIMAKTSFSLHHPQLWSVDNPQLYTAEITLNAGNKERDRLSIPFGIRTLEFSARKGFLLNGKPLELKGACVHHDNGLLGAAAMARADERKAELLKANGFNAVRCAHNLASESFLNACDRLGLLVIHETFDQWLSPKRPDDYHQYFRQWCVSDLTAGILRDRNHPCIIMWSIGNEISDRADEAGIKAAHHLIDTVRKYDTSRPVTAGVNTFWDRPYKWEEASPRAFAYLDVAGYNYMWSRYESDHAAHPERIIYGSESFPKEIAQNWNLVEKHPYVIGDFVWTAIDYLGEAGLGHALELAPGERDPQFMDWPWYNAWCGDLDFCGDKKPQSYYRDVVWRQRDIAMAVHAPTTEGKKEVVNGWGWPNERLSWTWPGLEGKTMTVNIYSRSPKVRLYLNGNLIGEKETDKELYTATFEVLYEPGNLTAQNVGGNKSSVTLQTTGSPAAIRLTPDRIRLKASGQDLSFIKIEIVDKNGLVIPDAAMPVQISCEGKGTVLTAGNGAYADMESFRSPAPKTFRGRAMGIIQSAEEAGNILVKVSAEGIGTSTVELSVE